MAMLALIIPTKGPNTMFQVLAILWYFMLFLLCCAITYFGIDEGISHENSRERYTAYISSLIPLIIGALGITGTVINAKAL